LTAEKPFVNLSVLRNYNFSLGLGLMFFAGLTLYGLTAIMPLFLQSLMGYTALQTGFAMIPRGLGAVIAMPIAGKLVTKVQPRYLVAGGFVSFGAATYWLSHLSLDLTRWVLFWPLFFSGVSIGFMFVPLNTLALGALKPEQLGNASGIFNLMRNVGGSVGISLVTTLVARGAQRHQTDLAAHLTPFDASYQAALHAATANFARHTDTVTAQHQALGSMYHTLVSQANLLAYLDNFRWFALLCVACLGGALLLKKAKVHTPVAAH
ncbi:MAG TPA: MFS transporter, partial [Verrucomicrobiae bacterium]|nr:MFS transporter [Verrucomicrobiae bacterium]